MNKDFSQQTWTPLLEDDLRHLVRLAVREDLDNGYDWTTVALISESSHGGANLVAREQGYASGLAAIPPILAELESSLAWEPTVADGAPIAPGQILGALQGSMRDLLTSERLLLNFVGHLSGIASLTAQFVAAVAGTKAAVYDTRKTHPGYRRLEKYAVRCGGGRNHRSGLYDAILIKDNHLAFAADQAGIDVADAVAQARRFTQSTLPDRSEEMIVEVEVDTLQQLTRVLPANPDIVLLDNMTTDQLALAVAQRDEIAPETQLEASGQVNLQTVPKIAATGVERISVGALTHSARCLDVGLDWKEI